MEGKASAKALRWEPAWYVSKMARRLVWLLLSESGRWREQEVRTFLICNLDRHPHFLVLSWGILEGVPIGYIVDAQ